MNPVRLRLVSRVIVLALVVIVGAAIAVHARAQPDTAQQFTLRGTLLNDPAPAFTLTDQTGATVALHELAGRPVVVTFLYTHCPDACPLTAEKLHTAARELGSDASKVAWLAVSLDPAGDTPATAQQFMAAHRLTGTLHFLLGSQSQLASVWQDYHIPVQPETVPAGQPDVVDHAIGVYLLDRRGHERVYLGSDFDPGDLGHDLRVLLAG